MSDERFGTDDDLAALRDLGRRAASDVVWEQPPEALWARVRDEALGPTAVSAAAVPLAPRRRAWLLPALGAAAAAVIAVAAAVVIAGRDDEGTDVLAATTLEALGERGSGRAELVEDEGALQLRLDTSDLDAGDGFLEVWLIDPSVTRLVSLGPLRPDGVYDLPAGLDPSEYPVVDVSVEPIDGNPTHSGDSVLRGELG